MQSGKTLVLGASEKPDRYSNMAIRLLTDYGHDVVAIGNREGIVGQVAIHTDHRPEENVDTVTMYLGAQNQRPYYEYILSLHPRRIIFNPGAENDELMELAQQNGIDCWEACTLVLLRTGQY
jgi:predicted CoA-binding protein